MVNVNNQDLLMESSSVQLSIKREDLIHPFISGNKYRKLKYNILEAQQQQKTTLLTFGGAYSNHIAATAFAGKLYGLNTIGIIRGDELQHQKALNPTLNFATENGMQLFFLSREDYKRKTDSQFISELKAKFGDFYMLPEGGTNDLAVKGCSEILGSGDSDFDYICCSVGTGGTVSGLINASQTHQKIIGFPALKGDFIKEDICKFATQDNWQLVTDYHFGGYGKIKPELITFMNTFNKDYHITLDPIYTGKLMYGLFDLIERGFFPKGSKVLAIHTGGLQGIAGMNERLRSKKLPLINT